MQGYFIKVDLRQKWQNESDDFTPWLAQEDSLALLGNTLGMNLVLEAQEQYVGLYRPDLVCRNTETGNLIVIENQLENSDNSHLARCFIYPALINADAVIWIAKGFCAEHLKALDMFNKKDGYGIHFFALEIELWNADYTLIPNFNMRFPLQKDTETIFDNFRLKNVEELTATQKLYLAYWTGFKKFLYQHGKTIKLSKPNPKSWFTFNIDIFHNVKFNINRYSKCIKVRFVSHFSNPLLPHREEMAYFNFLKKALELEIGENLEWKGEKHDGMYVDFHLPDVDLLSIDKWSHHYEQICVTAEICKNAIEQANKKTHGLHRSKYSRLGPVRTEKTEVGQVS